MWRSKCFRCLDLGLRNHVECNVHLLRFLRKNTEETGNGWSGKTIELLNEMNRERK
ncbi:MAG TPA: hypothetical protein IAB44_07700 [Candidatus Limivivens intestinipullorum]|uniref:Uncharacterized protein n=1 Tax=Candidatus Limivivens intestinipullorum TaxID=2840858 RepID=A0A9D1JKI4_9FIRM|nr:hypothetical protein [Candidatus Limivivens intestinipullorum]